MERFRKQHLAQLRLRKEQLLEAEKRRNRTSRAVLQILDDPRQWAHNKIEAKTLLCRETRND